MTKYKSLKKVCLLSDHHLSVNPRLWKEAFFYEKLGCEVVILTMWQSEEQLQQDRELLSGRSIGYKAFLDLTDNGYSSLQSFWFRARKRLAAALQKRFSISTPLAISYAPELLVRKALHEKADLYVAHLECGLFAGSKLLKKGKKVCFDFEDWYSRDYLQPSRPVRLLAQLEKSALRRGLFCTTTSTALSRALATAYDCNESMVIYNSFPAPGGQVKTVTSKRAVGALKILWFSRTIGPQRGLEFFLDALATCYKPVELTLVGNMRRGYEEVLQRKFNELSKHRFVYCPFMPFEELTEFIQQFSIGLAVEEPVNDNKLLTVSNKMMQYLQAGLNVIASDTPGQQEIAVYFPDRIALVDLNDPSTIQSALDTFRNGKPGQSILKEEQYQKTFSWEAQEKKLYHLIRQYFTLPDQAIVAT